MCHLPPLRFEYNATARRKDPAREVLWRLQAQNAQHAPANATAAIPHTMKSTVSTGFRNATATTHTTVRSPIRRASTASASLCAHHCRAPGHERGVMPRNPAGRAGIPLVRPSLTKISPAAALYSLLEDTPRHETRTHRVLLIAATTALGLAQEQKKGEKKGPPLSPAANTSVAINGKTIAIKYSAPSMRGRKISAAPAPSSPITPSGAPAPMRPPRCTPMPISISAAWPFPRGLHPVRLARSPAVETRGQQADRPVWHGVQPGEGPRPRAHDHEQTARSHRDLQDDAFERRRQQGKLQLEWENVIASVPLTVK